MEYPTSNMNSGQSSYTSHPQDTTRISPGCNPQSNPSAFPNSDTGPHGRAYSSYPPAYQTPNEFGSPGSHTAPNPPTYPHVYPPEGHGQSLTLNQLLQQGNTPNSYPPRPHGGPPLQAPYRAYEHYPYGYKPGVPGVGERPQGNTYPYAGTQGQRYTDPYGRPTYPPSSAYPYYQSPPPPQSMAQPPTQRQQPVSSTSSASCVSSVSPAQTHPMDFNCSNSGLPPRPVQSQTAVAGVHSSERPSSGTMNSNNVQHTHTHPSPVHGSQMSSPLHTSASNATPATNTSQPSGVWSGHTPQPPFGSPHQLAHGQISSSVQQNNSVNNSNNVVTGSRPRSSSRDSSIKASAGSISESSNDPGAHGTPQPADSDRTDTQMTSVGMTDDSGSRPQSRMSDSGRPSTANSTGSAGLRDQTTDDQNVASTVASSASSVPTSVTSSSADSSSVGASGPAQLDPTSSNTSSTFVSNPTLSPIPTTPRGTPPSHPYSAFPQPNSGVGNVPSSLQAVSGQSNAGPNRPPSQPNQSPRPYNMPPQSAMGPRQPYPPYMHSLAGQQSQPPQQQPHPHYMVGGRPPGFYPGTTVGPGGHPSMRPSMHPMGPIPGPGMSRSGAPFGSQGMMMPPPAAPPPPTNSNQANLSGPGAPPSASGFMAGSVGGPYPSPGSGPAGPCNSSGVWESHPQAGPASLSSAASSAMSQPHFSGGSGRPSPLYSGMPDRAMTYSGSPQPGAVSSGAPAPSHSGPHPQSSMAPGNYPHPPGQPPSASYQTHAPHLPYPSTQIPYGGAPHPIAQHAYVPGMAPSIGPGSSVPPYSAGGMTPSGPGAPGQAGREQPQLHSPYTSDMVPSSGVGSPAGVVRGVPVSGVGNQKLPTGAPALGKVAKLDGGIRPMTPNSAGSSIQNASPHANISGVMDESVSGSAPVQPHQQIHHQQQSAPPLSQSGMSANPGPVQQAPGSQQQHQSPSPCVMPPSGQPGMQPFPGNSSGYWSDTGAPNQFSGAMPPTGMGPQGPHAFPSFPPHYRMPGSGAPPPPPATPGPAQTPQGMQAQHPHNMPNSINCPTSISGAPIYGSSMSPYGSAHSHAHPVGHTGISTQSSSVFHRLLEMGTEPERRAWLEHYVRFMEEIGKPLVGLPQVVKQPLDLYRFYLAVRERGGVLEVIKARRWKEISQLVNINASASAAYTLRKNYCKFLLDYECRFDRGGADPNPLLAHIEAMSGKKKKPSSVDDGSTPLSASGHSLSAQAPPSPAGSHSSASSSLLPPGSGSASLSGVPSGTAGSAASDSQLGPSAPQSRFGDPCAQSSNSAVGESPNGVLSSPGSGVLTGHGAASSTAGSASFSQSSAQSPPRPPSGTTMNGYPNTPHGPVEAAARPTTNWPWISDSGISGSHQPPVVSVNGFPSSMSPIRGPLSAHGMQHGFDPSSRPNATTPIPSPKSAQARVPTPGANVTSVPQPARSPIPSSLTSSAPSSIGLPSSNPNVIVTSMKASDVPTQQQQQQQQQVQQQQQQPPPPHHPLAGHYAPPSGSAPPGMQPQLSNQSQMPPTHHTSFMGTQQHPSSPMHPSMPPHGIPGPAPPGSPMHPRLASTPGIRGPPYGGGPPGVNPAHNLGGPPNDSIALLRMHNIRPPSSGPPPAGPAYPPNAAIPPFHHGQPNSTGQAVPAHLIHHHGQRPGYVATILKRIEHFPFPPGSIEATQIEPSRRRRYRVKDIGTVSPFKLLMALRSGLTAEVSWALNCLNILLRDESGLENFTGGSLGSLINNLAELWRHSLGELFDHNLFVCSLELPTNLTTIGRSLSTENKPVSTNTIRDESKLHMFPPSSLSFGMMKKKHLTVGSMPNGLVSLERDLVALAATRGVSVSSLRDGIRRMLRKCGDPIGDFIPMRARNGLLLNPGTAGASFHCVSNSGTSGNHPLVPHSASTLIDSSLPGGRTRKRGSKQLSSGYGYGQSGLGSTTVATGTSHTINCSSNVLSQTFSSALKSENVPPSNVATRVTTAPNSLRSPVAYTNLRELALYVIDELLRTEPALRSRDARSDGEDDDEDEDEDELVPPPPPSSSMGANSINVHNPHAYWSMSAYLRDLIQHGGGDTTCHIMPPFGAAPYSSRHWRGDSEHDESLPAEPGVPIKSSSTPPPPPPEVGEEKCPLRGSDLMEYESLEEDDEDGGHIRSKRARHASSSSLPCPVLSPQPIEEVSEDSEVKPNPGETTALKSTTSTEQQPDSSDTVADEQDETEFSQLIMDANGRCPLRAREELVHHGPACLWPDHSEANSNEARAVRCLCVSTVLRNLSFWHLAEVPLSSHKPTLALIGRVITLGHKHVGAEDTWQSVEEASKLMESSQCAWRTPSWLDDMRENALVLLVNLAGYLDLIRFEESIVRPILEGLLHWIICPTAVAIDPFPGHRTLSPRRLALEALNRLCVRESNVDLLLCTPGSRESDLHLLFGRLAHWLALPEDQVTRELALSTMHYLTGGGVSFNTLNDPATGKSRGSIVSSMQTGPTSFVGTTLLSSAKPCPVAGLLSFIEAAEATTRRVIDQCGVQALQERPELMGTSLEMVRRAGALLDRLAADPTGRTRFTPTLELRLLDLVTSRVLDATVAHLLCGALHRLSQNRQVSGDDADVPIITPLVPPIPALSVVAQLIKPPTPCSKSESTCNPDSAGSAKSESKTDTSKVTITDDQQQSAGASNISSKTNVPDTESVSVVPNVDPEKQAEKKISDPLREVNLVNKDTTSSPPEPVNHMDNSRCDVPVRKECTASVPDISVSKTDNEQPLATTNSVDSVTWNSNCVDS
ncbi:unnamed protein product [Echinostoma caproni]|uniref:ARID domain-containing protein n=1 Tax=Echinostoma caproni TaxID=27848 RepID=A0A183ABQ1_9TREM|nr:unnamed protein product [Echinostoma caproni]